MTSAPRPTRLVTPLSRRTLLQGLGVTALGLAATPFVSACGTKGAAKSAAQQTAQDMSAQEKVVNFSNFPLYIDTKGSGIHPTLEEFQRQTGISCSYHEDINDDETEFAKLRPALSAGNDPGIDLFMTSGALVGRYIRLGWIQKYDLSVMPNRKNLLPGLEGVPWDPHHEYSLLWQNYFTGIAYDARKFPGGVHSVKDLLSPSVKGRVIMFNTMADTLGLLLLAQGDDPSRFTDAQFDRAIETLTKIASTGQVKRFAGSDYLPDLVKGSVDATFAWSGDVVQVQDDNPHIRFVFPDEGCIISASNLVIPNKARHKTNAEKLIDFYYQPEVAAQLSAWVAYMSPVAGAQEAMQKIDPKLATSELIFPSTEQLSRAHGFMTLSEEQEKKYNQAFNTAIGL